MCLRLAHSLKWTQVWRKEAALKRRLHSWMRPQYQRRGFSVIWKTIRTRVIATYELVLTFEELPCEPFVQHLLE